MFHFLVVFILRFVKTGTPTLLSVPQYSVESSAMKKAKLNGSLYIFFYFQVTKVSASSKVKNENGAIRNRISDFDKRRIFRPKTQ